MWPYQNRPQPNFGLGTIVCWSCSRTVLLTPFMKEQDFPSLIPFVKVNKNKLLGKKQNKTKSKGIQISTSCFLLWDLKRAFSWSKCFKMLTLNICAYLAAQQWQFMVLNSPTDYSSEQHCCRRMDQQRKPHVVPCHRQSDRAELCRSWRNVVPALLVRALDQEWWWPLCVCMSQKS